MIKKIRFFDTDSLRILHQRVFFSILIFIFLFSVSIYRISAIMILNKEEVVSENLHKHIRGNIFDNNGKLLATSINSKSISINPKKIKNKDSLISSLSNILSIKEEKLINIFSSNSSFQWLKRNISPKEHQSIINLGEINIKTHNETKRVYAYRNVASHIVGYVNIDQKGLSGIERYYNSQLEMSEDIHLTININLQQAVRKRLLNKITEYDADNGLAVVMDITNGNILSSVSLPDFNPEKNSTFNNKNLVNRVIQSNFEMGSTFKPLTATIGYDLDIIQPNKTFDVKKKYKGISDHLPYKDDGIYNVEKIIVESSNIGTAQIASLIGKINQKSFFKKIGFEDKVEIEILESAEPLGNKNNWGPLETATIGFGHGFSVTPLHLVKAYATLANGGFIVNPTLNKVNKYNESEIVLNKNTSSRYFLNLLQAVISKTKFTGPRVKIEGYNIGGKTGTTELVNPEGGYFNDRNLTSFISVFPINNPKYIVYTAIEYPKNTENTNQRMTGAVVNAPLVKEIILDMIRILNISRNENSEYLKADTNLIYTYKNEPS